MNDKANEKYAPCQCPRCGELFICRGDMNCWCLEVNIPEPVNDYISAHYEGCLCPKCLIELKENFRDKK